MDGNDQPIETSDYLLGAFPGRKRLHFPVMADQTESETLGFNDNRSDMRKNRVYSKIVKV